MAKIIRYGFFFLGLLLGFLLIQLVIADHRDPDLPFCGDGIVETTPLWDEASGNQECILDTRNFSKCPGDDNFFEGVEAGESCVRYRSDPKETGLCVRPGICLVGGERYFGVVSRIVVVDKLVGLNDYVLIYVFDPGRERFTTDAMVKEILPGGEEHYLANFCNGAQDCVTTNLEGSSLIGNKDGKWSGFARNQQPGPLLRVDDFSNWFEEEPNEEDKQYWFQTRMETKPHLSYFGFKEPGEYRLVIFDTRGNKLESESFFVCNSPDCEPTLVEGNIADGHGHNLFNLEVNLTQEPDLLFTVYTDENGDFSFNEMIDREKDVKLTFTFRGANNKFRLFDNRNGLDDPIFATTKPMKYDEVQDLINFVDDIDLFQVTNAHNKSDLDDIAIAHWFTASAVKFAEDVLETDMGKYRPYEVNLFANSSGSFYREVFHNTYIAIGGTDSEWDDFDRPDNGDWHEFSHGLMQVSRIGGEKKIPESRSGKAEFNHLGRANPSTTDSLVEGFAVFISSVISNELDYSGQEGDAPWIYRYGSSSTFHLEDNIKVWDDMGRREDTALATLLWDLYDSSQMYGVDDDRLSLPIKTIWKIINNEEIRDVKDVYDALKASFDVDNEFLDEIFVAHGFFVDENMNKQQDVGEEIGRSAFGGSFLTAFELGGGGYGSPWDIDLPIGSLVSPDKFDPQVAIPAGDTLRWGSADIDGDGDIAKLIWKGDDIEEYESAVVDIDKDGDFGSITDLDGDGKGELTTNPFWVYPYLGRRDVPVFPEELISVNTLDREGQKIPAHIIFSYHYPNHPERNYNYTVLSKGQDLSLWVPEGAILTLKAEADSFSSETIVFSSEQFRDNLFPKKNQGNITFTLSTTDDKLSNSSTSSDQVSPQSNGDLSGENLWLIIIIVAIIIVVIGVVIFRKR